MLSVDMRGNDKSVFSFEEAHGKFIAHAICLLRRDFAGFE